jgi:hypothetical protein
MTRELQAEALNDFREEALQRGIPSADVERWITATARPCALLSLHGDGPVVGRFGGPLALPAGEPDPGFPLIASVDCAAVPREATDLPLPTDGHLLFFGYLEHDTNGGGGRVVRIPPGATLEEREEDPWFQREDARPITEQYPQGDIHLITYVSLPSQGRISIPEPPYGKPLPEHPLSEELAKAWLSTKKWIRGSLQIGGYADDEYGGDWAPLLATAADDPDGWVLLADWYADIEGREGAVIHWGIRRRDLAAQRLEEVEPTVFWAP